MECDDKVMMVSSLNKVNAVNLFGQKFAQSDILCITLLYFTLLYFTLLYFTLLYFTLLYFTLLNNLSEREKDIASAYMAEKPCVRTQCV